MNQYGVVFKTKNGRYSETVLTMVIDAKNKEEAKQDALEQLYGNKYSDIFSKDNALSNLNNIFDRSTERCFYITAHRF